MVVFATKSPKQTQDAANILVQEVMNTSRSRAIIIALEGELGTGKTTFVQGFARALGIKDTIQSPTFVLMKIYTLKQKKNLKRLVHIDAYRLESARELEHMGVRKIFQDKDAVVLIEWADRVKHILPKERITLRFKHVSPRERTIISSYKLFAK